MQNVEVRFQISEFRMCQTGFIILHSSFFLLPSSFLLLTSYFCLLHSAFRVIDLLLAAKNQLPRKRTPSHLRYARAVHLSSRAAKLLFAALHCPRSFPAKA